MLSTFAEAYLPERRRDQFKGTPGYYIAQIPYRLTGIGEGLILLGAALNIMDTNTDAYVMRIGETDRTKIDEELGLDCGAIVDPVDQKKCNQLSLLQNCFQ